MNIIAKVLTKYIFQQIPLRATRLKNFKARIQYKSFLYRLKIDAESISGERPGETIFIKEKIHLPYDITKPVNNSFNTAGYHDIFI